MAEGKKHNRKLADETGFRFPAGSRLGKGAGFQGDKPEGVETFPRDGDLRQVA